MGKRRIAVVKRADSAGAWELLQKVQDAFPDVQLRLVQDEQEEACPIKNIEVVSAESDLSDIDMVLCLGGDGTIIRAAGLFPTRIVPILAVNLGRLGFLAEIASHELLTLFPKALAEQLPYEDRMRLWAKVETQGRVVLDQPVLNDVVVASGNLARITTYLVERDGKQLTEFRGDGVVVSTPTGSTAYSMAAGGPIVEPGIEACIVTPICPHHLTHRPVVLRAEGELTIACVQGNQAFVTLDGQSGYGIHHGDVIRITKASVPVRLLQHPDTDHFHTLRTKLLWGQG